MQLADGVYRVPTAPADLVNSFIFCDDDGPVSVVDAGMSFGGRRLAAALNELGWRPAANHEATRGLWAGGS